MSEDGEKARLRHAEADIERLDKNQKRLGDELGALQARVDKLERPPIPAKSEARPGFSWALDDAVRLGVGYLRVWPNGRLERLDPESVLVRIPK